MAIPATLLARFRPLPGGGNHGVGQQRVGCRPRCTDGGRDLRFVAIHEIGHIVDFLGFDDQARAAFKALFQSSARWKACFPDPFANKHACLPFSEVFADQFAYWITGYPADPTGGYEDPPLVSRAAFGHLIGSQFAFRPPYWRNPAR
jgi:hypothetical protein